MRYSFIMLTLAASGCAPVLSPPAPATIPEPPLIARAALLEFTGDTSTTVTMVPERDVRGPASITADSIGRTFHYPGAFVLFAKTATGFLAYFNAFPADFSEYSDSSFLAFITDQGEYRHGRTQRQIDSLGLTRHWESVREIKVLPPWRLTNLLPADSAGVYGAVLRNGVDTALGDATDQRRLVYLPIECPPGSEDSLHAWHPMLRSCRTGRSGGCPGTTPRSLDFEVLRAMAADTVEIPFEIDLHRKEVAAGPPINPTWQLLRAWQMGMFMPIGWEPIGGGCSALRDSGRYLLLVRVANKWVVRGIRSTTGSILRICA